jgi:hypothetical protein
MPPLRSEAVNRDQAVARPDYLLQLERELPVWLQPCPGCANHPFVAVIGLASVVGQDVVLEDDVGIEKREVYLIALAPALAEGSKLLHVLLRHRLLRQPGGFEDGGVTEPVPCG